MDIDSLAGMVQDSKDSAEAVLALGTGAVGILSAWWWARPRMVAIDKAGGRKAWRKLSRHERRIMIREARQARR